MAESMAIWAALGLLTDMQRAVLVLRYYGDCSEAQIADTLGCSRGAVKTHASRGVASLRKSLRPEGPTSRIVPLPGEHERTTT